MKKRTIATIALAASVTTATQAEPKPPVVKTEIRINEKGKKVKYMFIDGIKVHEADPAKRPQPKVVAPKPYDAQAAKPPKNATILFDGSEKTFQNWTDKKGQPTRWKLVDKALESVKRAGYLQSKQQFGSCKLHIEFATPKEVKGNGQGRGNSGVFLMGQYEVQILDSYQNQTYPDGQCGALYGRAVPLVNACGKPGEWQTYDITFTRPKFNDKGEVVRRAKFHVVHNGHVIHDNVELWGGTGWDGPHAATEYKAHADKGPLQLQDHGNPVRFRNIWVVAIND